MKTRKIQLSPEEDLIFNDTGMYAVPGAKLKAIYMALLQLQAGNVARALRWFDNFEEIVED